MHLLYPVRLLQSFLQPDIVEDACIAWRDGQIVFAGGYRDCPNEFLGWPKIDGNHQLATPALIDCHTHLVFAGHRADEFEARLRGESYPQIAARGGGISSSVRAVQATDEAELLRQSLPRARALIADGVATVEIKSGYGLTLEAERKQLHVAQQIEALLGISVRRTFLALHTLPDTAKGSAEARDTWITQVCQEHLPELAGAGLVDAVDAFCEHLAFTPREVRQLFESARNLNLPVKLHAEQLSDQSGASLVAEFGGLSADHLEYLSAQGIAAMAKSGTVAVLLPAAFYCLRETRLPPIEQLRTAGVPMAVASDCNPGTSPVLGLRSSLHMACTLFGLQLFEALAGATSHAAKALGLADRGELRVGLRADIALWDVHSPSELVYWLGPIKNRVYSGGKMLSPLP